jgi:ubiquitin C-terminal hydrolase
LHFYPFPDNEKDKSYKPDAIKKYLSEINCVYKSEKKRNPNELFSFILDILHNELKMHPSGALVNPNNIFDKKEVIRTGFNNFEKYDHSQISKDFNWFEIKETRCTQCNRSMYSFQTYHMFELDILNTSKFVANNRNYNNNNSITIYDCLTYYESIKNNLRAYCKSCNKNTKVDCACKIFRNPKIFAFSLNRGLINGKFDDNLTDINFQLNDQIDLGNFVSENIQNSKYELIGIVSISRRLKNYVSFCKSPVDNNWYSYDSENICPSNIHYILSEHDSTKETDNIPCILVYQSIKLSH